MTTNQNQHRLTADQITSLFRKPIPQSATLAYLNFFEDEKAAIASISEQNIRVSQIPEINAYILNYEQIESNKNGFKKTHPIIRECRNLVVRFDTTSHKWSIIGKSFNRFFNWGESLDEQLIMTQLIEGGHVRAFEKLDGSLIQLSFIDGEWRVFTRGSYADTNPFRGTLIQASTNTPYDTFGARVRKYIDLEKLDPKHYYVFELCTPGAHITNYKEEFLALLTVVEAATHDEVPYPLPEKFTLITPEAGVPIKTPHSFPVTSFEDFKTIMGTQPPDFEGYVLAADIRGLDHINRTEHTSIGQPGVPFRIKVKSESYVELHHLGTKTFTIEDLCRVVVKGEETEVGETISMHKHVLDKLTDLYQKSIDAIVAFYTDNYMLPRKTYALYVCERLDFNDINDRTEERKTNITTPLPNGDHPAVPRYPAITKMTLKPFNWLYFDFHSQKIKFTVRPDGSNDLRTILAEDAIAEKVAASLSVLHRKVSL